MKGFFKSFVPLQNAVFKKYKTEVVLLAVAVLLAVGTVVSYASSRSSDEDIVFSAPSTATSAPEKIFVDLSGSVKKPGSYELPSGKRLSDIIALAGGLTEGADKLFFARNFNLSRLLSDQEKIYVPSRLEVSSGVFTESPKVLDFTSSASTTQSESTTSASEGININAASSQELDTLPGVGPVTAGKIIDNRPYATIEELLEKKIVGSSVFENIKDLITTQ